MNALLYPVGVKTVDEIRLANYRRLTAEVQEHLGREPSGVELADALGISAAYVSQIKTGKRTNIEEESARKMEDKRGKERGWMDNDQDLWPFQSLSAERFAKLPERFKGMAEQEVRRILEEWESKGGDLGGSGPSSEDGSKRAAGQG